MTTFNPLYPANQPTGNIYLDSLIWGGSWSDGGGGNTNITWSASIGQLFENEPSVVGDTWLGFEVGALRSALQVWSNVANVTFTEVPTSQLSNVQYYNISGTDMQALEGGEFGQVLGFHEVPDGTWPEPLHGVFNNNGVGWTELSLKKGGLGFTTLVHEIGHGLGLAHPHDDGGGSSVFPGVTDPFGSLGDFDLNQGIWTVMSYNDGWIEQPSSFVDISYGQVATPMAFDIAAIQAIYGANLSYNAGNNTYLLPRENVAGTFWSSIWDAGGKDVISAKGISGDVNINLNAAPLVGENAAGYVSYATGIVGGYTIANNVVIENAIGGNGNDELVGNAVANVLEGGLGDDILNGGLGADKMVGGKGSDTYFVDTLDDKVIETSGATAGQSDEVRSIISYMLGANIENLTLIGGEDSHISGTGNKLNNNLIGSAGNNRLDGGKGADRLQGGQGNDTYVVDSALDTVVEFANQGIDTVETAIHYSIASVNNVENITLLGRANLNATGNTLNNLLVGNAGKNILDGGKGSTLTSFDTMVGGAGNDTYIVRHSLDAIVELSNQGVDTVLSRVNYVLSEHVENITLTDGSKNGGYAYISATGNSLNNVMFGNAGDNSLDGALGADKMTGGDGNDSYYVDNAGDKVFEKTNEGKDEVHSTINYVLGANLEQLFLMGAAISGTGNNLNNYIEGNDANNILRGESGDDKIVGGLGADSLTGGTGADTFVFRLIAESSFGANVDTITDFKSSESDRIDLSFIDASDALVGNNAFTFIGTTAFTANAGELRFDLQTHSVLGDTNGDGVADLQIQLAAVSTVDSAVFFL